MRSIFKKIPHRYTVSILIGLIILISIPPRIWNLNISPPVVVDEPAYLRDISKIMHEGDYYFANPQWDFSQSYLDYYPTIAIMKLGITNGILALRLSSALFSLLGAVFFFLIIRKHLDDFMSFFGTILYSSGFLYLQFSRVGWNVIHALSLGIGGIYFAMLAVEKRSISYSLLSALLTSLAFYSYRSGEIYILATILYFLIQIIINKQKSYLSLFIIYVSFFLLFSGPWILYITGHLSQFMLRQNVVSIFNAPIPYFGNNDIISILIYQTITTLKTWILMFPIMGNGGHIENSRYLPLSFPPINPILIPLYWSGLFILFKNIKKFYIWIFIFIFGLITSQVLTVFPPNGARGLILLPVIYLAILISLNKLYKMLPVKNAKIILTIFTFLICILDVSFYIYWMGWIKV